MTNCRLDTYFSTFQTDSIVLNVFCDTLSRMPKIYSIDLRERVLQSLDEGLSKMAAHRTFRVSRSTIEHWLALRAQTGSVRPCASRAGRPSWLRGEIFRAFVCRHADATLDEMVQAWQHETGVSLSDMAFSRALRALGWTRKKRVGVSASATKRRAPRG